MSDPIGVAVIGLGVGAAHARAAARHAGARVVVLADRDPDRLREVAREHPGAATTPDADEAIAWPGVDVVVVATYDADHGAQVMAALDHGRHVFAEKPLCTRREELDAIAARLTAARGLHLSSNLILRRDPRFIAAHQVIRQGKLGEVFHVEGHYLYGRLEKLTHGWRGRDPAYSVMLGGGTHVLDALAWLTGLRFGAVIGALHGNVASRAAGSPFAGPDQCTALLRLGDAASAIVTANFGCVQPHAHHLTIYGTDATLRLDESGVLFTRSRDRDNPGAWWCRAWTAPDKGVLLTAFLDALLAGAPPEPSFADIEHVLRTAMAIDRVAGGR